MIFVWIIISASDNYPEIVTGDIGHRGSPASEISSVIAIG